MNCKLAGGEQLARQGVSGRQVHEIPAQAVEMKTAVVGMGVPATAVLIFLIWLLKWFCYSQGISSCLINRQVISFF